MRPLSASDQFFDVDPAARLLRIDEVCAHVGLSRTMIYKRMKQRPSPFPKPLKVGALSRWDRRDIDEWIDRLKGDPAQQGTPP